MALIDRIGRLFTADLHAVLDRLEEPDVLLKQAIREMEDDLASGEARLRWLDHEDAQLDRQLGEVDAALAAIADQLETCFASNEETLTRPLIKRRLEAQRLASRLASRRDANAKDRTQQSACIDEHRRELDALRQRAEILLDGAAAASGRPTAGTAALDASVTDADVEVELLREKQRRSRT
jgi:phage shock protein A